MKRRVKQVIYLIFKKFMFYFYLIIKGNKYNIPLDEANDVLNQYSRRPEHILNAENTIEDEQNDLTIIVPVYNVEKFVEQCITSILYQKTKYSFDIIIVNDGSTDKSKDILKQYATVDNVKIINQQNLGISVARNKGLERIYSRYIMFVDSDDYLVDGAVEKMLDVAYIKHADIVQGSYVYLDNEKNKVIGKKIFKNLTDVPSNGVISGMPWGKIYKANLFKNVSFPVGYWYEDSIITGIVSHLAKSIVTTSEIVYTYRQHGRSITKVSKMNPKAIDTLWVTNYVLEERKKFGLYTDQAFYEHLLRQVVLNYERTQNLPEKVKQSIFVLTKNLLQNEYSNEFVIKNKKYKELDKAIKEGDWGKYSFLCKYVL